MKGRRRFLLGAALVSMAGAVSAGWNSLEGRAAPEVTVEKWINPFEGNTLEDLRGKAVLLEFWATW